MNSKKEEKKYLFDNMKMIAEAIGKTFGKNCEVVIHDYSVPNHSIIKIVNGHITGRKIGDSVTTLALTDWRKGNIGGNSVNKMLNYQTKTKNGEILKSSSVFIKDKQNKIIGSLCINYRISEFLIFRNIVEEFCTFNKEKNEIFTNNVKEALGAIIDKAIKKVGKPISILNREDKLKIINLIVNDGGFLIKGSIEQVANELKISRYTIYNYLKELNFKNKT